MIGLAGLADGGHLLEHPLGPIWVRVRGARIDRAELWVVRRQRFLLWPQDVGRAWQLNVRVAAAELRKGVMAAG